MFEVSTLHRVESLCLCGMDSAFISDPMCDSHVANIILHSAWTLLPKKSSRKTEHPRDGSSPS